MYRTKAYRRSMMRKVKNRTKKLLNKIWGESELSLDKTIIGKFARSHKHSLCEQCCNKRKIDGLTKQELVSLDELKHFEQYN